MDRGEPRRVPTGKIFASQRENESTLASIFLSRFKFSAKFYEPLLYNRHPSVVLVAGIVKSLTGSLRKFTLL